MVDQFGFAPIFLPSFMGVLWTLEGRSNIPQQLVEVSPDLIVANWSLWVPAMTINFGFVPLKYQVLFGNVVALLWNVYLSYMNAVSKEHQEQNEPMPLFHAMDFIINFVQSILTSNKPAQTPADSPPLPYAATIVSRE